MCTCTQKLRVHICLKSSRKSLHKICIWNRTFFSKCTLCFFCVVVRSYVVWGFCSIHTIHTTINNGNNCLWTVSTISGLRIFCSMGRLGNMKRGRFFSSNSSNLPNLLQRNLAEITKSNCLECQKCKNEAYQAQYFCQQLPLPESCASSSYSSTASTIFCFFAAIPWEAVFDFHLFRLLHSFVRIVTTVTHRRRLF